MNITAIRRQQKQTIRYSVYVDGRYSFSLSESELIKQGLKIGQSLTDQALQALTDTATTDKAYNLALRYIAIRPRSEWEMIQYLRRKHYEVELINAVMSRLRQGRWLDDAAFARAWVESRQLLKSSSRRRLVQELRQKQVSDDIITSVINDSGQDDQAALDALIVKKLRQSKYRADPQKLMQYLARQGFAYPDIKSALSKNTS